MNFAHLIITLLIALGVLAATPFVFLAVAGIMVGTYQSLKN